MNCQMYRGLPKDKIINTLVKNLNRWNVNFIFTAFATTMLILLGSPAYAQQESEVSADGKTGDKRRTYYEVTLRPTFRSFYNYNERAKRDFETALLRGADGNTYKHDALTPLRLELKMVKPISENFDLFTRLMGGQISLSTHPGQNSQHGFDAYFDVGVGLEQSFSELDRLRTTFGLRAYRWFFPEDEIPRHGYTGAILGIQPYWGKFSVLFEAGLLALPLFDKRGNNGIGWLKDNSSLRMQFRYDLTFRGHKSFVGTEVFHTKSEFTGSDFIPGQNTYAFDDVQTSLLMGIQF
jgi:hypothetical protein